MTGFTAAQRSEERSSTPLWMEYSRRFDRRKRRGFPRATSATSGRRLCFPQPPQGWGEEMPPAGMAARPVDAKKQVGIRSVPVVRFCPWVPRDRAATDRPAAMALQRGKNRRCR